MSSKSAKLLENAQKLIAKGQLDRAIKEYQQIVSIEQSDIKHRQKLAELLVRVNRKIEAATEYEIIAKHYSQGLFYLKAIAVYKQIQKLDPDNLDVRFALAALYAKQGLSGNALTEYNLLADHYQKQGLNAEALKVIEHMLEVDQDNPNSRQRLADALLTAGQGERSFQEFIKLALHYRKGGDETSFAKVQQRVEKLFPDHKDFELEVLDAQIAGGGSAVAIPFLREIVRKDKTDLKAWELLADACLRNGETGERKEVLQSIIENFPDRLSPLESMIQTLLEEDDIPGSLDLLKKHSDRFIGEGARNSLERYYVSLREKAPDNVEVLQLLKNFYETGGEGEKLASLDESAATAESDVDVKSVMPASPPGDEAPSLTDREPPPDTAVAPDHMSWEEEIDLSILDDGETTQFSYEPGEDEAPSPPGISVSDEPVADDSVQEMGPRGEKVVEESEDFREISLEIDESLFQDGNWQQDLPPLDGDDTEVQLQETDWTGDEASPSPWEGESAAVNEEGRKPVTEIPPEGEEPLIKENLEEIPPPGRKRKKYDLDGQFSEFKKGLDQQLDKGDTETHYNLGIAYKEMGLFDDAVSEFRTAADDPHRRIDCLTLEAICHRDKGDFISAEDVFRDTLALEGLSPEERLSINYELAFLCEIMGRREDAIKFYREVQASSPGFRDAAKKIAHLQGSEEEEESVLLELDVEEMD